MATIPDCVISFAYHPDFESQFHEIHDVINDDEGLIETLCIPAKKMQIKGYRECKINFIPYVKHDEQVQACGQDTELTKENAFTIVYLFPESGRMEYAAIRAAHYQSDIKKVVPQMGIASTFRIASGEDGMDDIQKAFSADKDLQAQILHLLHEFYARTNFSTDVIVVPCSDDANKVDIHIELCGRGASLQTKETVAKEGCLQKFIPVIESTMQVVTVYP